MIRKDYGPAGSGTFRVTVGALLVGLAIITAVGVLVTAGVIR